MTRVHTRRPRRLKPKPRPVPRRRIVPATDYAIAMIHRICCLAGSTDLLTEIAAEGNGQSLHRSIRKSDTPALFNWLMQALSYQGISDQVAADYMRRHGTITWQQ